MGKTLYSFTALWILQCLYVHTCTKALWVSGSKTISHSANTSYMYVQVHMYFPAVLSGLASTHPIVYHFGFISHISLHT